MAFQSGLLLIFTVHNENPKYDVGYITFTVHRGFSKVFPHEYAMQEIARREDA